MHVFSFVMRAVPGGIALGLAWGVGAMLWLYLLFDDPITEIMVTVLAAYSLWLVSDLVSANATLQGCSASRCGRRCWSAQCEARKVYACMHMCVCA